MTASSMTATSAPDIHLKFCVSETLHSQQTTNIDSSSHRYRLSINERLSARGVTAIYGASGAGKSTLLRCIAGLIHARGGLCRIGDQVWQDETLFLPTHQRALGYVFQHSSLFQHLNVEKNLQYGYQRTAAEKRKVRYDDAVHLLGLTHLTQRFPAQLSGGEKQRVAMAQALLRSPRLLLMDEPLASLDTESKQAILPYLEQIHETLEIPLIYVSHSLSEILRIADNLLVIEDGQVIGNGSLNDILIRDDLPLAYLDEAGVVIDGTVNHIDTQHHLAEVETTAGTFFVSGINEMNDKLHRPSRLRIAARDVSIALSTHDVTSLQHRLAATVVALNPHKEPAKTLVTLKVGREKMLASITRKSAEQLRLQPGDRVYAQVKSVSLV